MSKKPTDDVIANLKNEIEKSKQRIHILESEKAALQGLFVAWRAKCLVLTQELRRVAITEASKKRRHDA